MKPSQSTEKGFNGANYSMDEICIKEEPLKDGLVSKFFIIKHFDNFSLHVIILHVFHSPN